MLSLVWDKTSQVVFIFALTERKRKKCLFRGLSWPSRHSWPSRSAPTEATRMCQKARRFLKTPLLVPSLIANMRRKKGGRLLTGWCAGLGCCVVDSHPHHGSGIRCDFSVRHGTWSKQFSMIFLDLGFVLTTGNFSRSSGLAGTSLCRSLALSLLCSHISWVTLIKDANLPKMSMPSSPIRSCFCSSFKSRWERT